MNVGRRAFVTSCAALAVGAGTTGCLDGNGGDGTGDGTDGENGTGDDGNEDGTGDGTNGDGIPEPTEADYATWLFDPETVSREIETHGISYKEPASVPMSARAGNVDTFDAYDSFISVGNSATVFDFASEEVFAGEMDGWGLTEAEPVEERGNYAVYNMVEENNIIFGVDFEEMLVIGSGYDGVTRAIIHTRIGDAEPYTQTNDDMGLLIETLGGGHVAEGQDEGFSENATAAGIVKNGNEDGTVDVRAVEVFPDEQTVDTVAFEEGVLNVFENRYDDDTLEIDEVQQDGRVAVAVGTSDGGIYFQG
ncbi:MAG: hypothetical protein U5J64_06230 [Halobacteriales archaeon]|nr:hypothetical protein [Halobacteriales archaeon]